MPEMTPEEYQEAYDAEMKKLDEADAPKGAAITEPVPKQAEKPQDELKTKDPAEEPNPDESAETVEQLRERLAKMEKSVKDTQAWGTKNAQELAQLKREREQQERASSRPEILDQAPELEKAIRYVTQDPTPRNKAEDQQAAWLAQVEKVHPGIFSLADDDELVSLVDKRRQVLGGDWSDPLEAIRAISEEKLALKERQVGQRLAQASAQNAKKQAMSVPGASSSGTTRRAPDADDDAKKEVDRVWNMSDADFARMANKVKGL